MPILAFLSSLFAPAVDVVKTVEANEATKLQLQNQLGILQNQLAAKMIDYESQLLSAQADVVKAEANGSSWIQRNWRPITMLVFLVLVVLDSFKWLPNPLAPQAWTLLQIGLGGYVIGRSAEKIAPHVATAMKDSNQ